MKVLVCGGRDFDNRRYLNSILDLVAETIEVTELIHGDAPGADRMSHTWATCAGVATRVFPANWSALGKAAGAIRNKRMLEEGNPDLVIAFPGGKGTLNMIAQARAAGVHVEVIPAVPEILVEAQAPKEGSGMVELKLSARLHDWFKESEHG